MVECGFVMAASKTLSPVPQPERSGGGSAAGQNGSAVLSSFQCPPEEDAARSRCNGNCEDHRAEFLSVKEANRRKKVNRLSSSLDPCRGALFVR